MKTYAVVLQNSEKEVDTDVSQTRVTDLRLARKEVFTSKNYDSIMLVDGLIKF